MRRSSSIKLVLMASTAVGLTACGQEPVQGEVYRTVEACIAGQIFTPAACDQSFEVVQTLHTQSAPRYNSQTLCEEQHGVGNCNQPASSNSMTGWRPFIAGYFVSSFLRDGGTWGNRARPLYASTRGGAYTPGGYPLRRDASTGAYQISQRAMTTKPVAAKLQTRTTMAARGGFGSRASRAGG